MGAGSSTGLRRRASADNADQLSINSEGHWDDSKAKRENAEAVARRSKSFDLASSKKESVVTEQQDADEEPVNVNKKETKKKFFSFKTNREEITDKDSDQEPETVQKKESTSTNRRFKFFGGRKKESQKDEKLESDIEEMVKTFDSLGIIQKTNWGDGTQDIRPKQKSKDDLDALEPMRNKSNVRISRPPRGMNGVTAGSNFYGRKDADLNSTTSSKKKFNFSWDTEEERSSTKPVDEWQYQTVKIDGFDVSKFKKVNTVNTLDLSSSVVSAPSILRTHPQDAPLNASFNSRRSRSPSLQYDADDQQILASIERALI